VARPWAAFALRQYHSLCRCLDGPPESHHTASSLIVERWRAELRTRKASVSSCATRAFQRA